MGAGHHGKPHEGKARSCIVPFIDQTARLCALLDDARILGIATSLLGDDFNYMGSDGNYYVGDTGWHSDGWHSNFTHIKIALYLDPLTRDTGAIRVIPGSHLPGDTYANALAEKLVRARNCGKLTARMCPPSHWKPCLAMSFASITTPNMLHSVEVRDGECSRLTFANNTPKANWIRFAATSAGMRGTG